MEGRWRGQRPFERGRARTPWIVCRLLLAHERVCYAEEEYQCAESREIRAERRDEVPAGESIGVVSDATRHAGEPKEMLGKEDNVDANEGQPEVQLADRLRIHVAGHFREPIIPPGKDGEDRAQREHVMEMRHHVISILQRSVDAGIGEHHAGHAADSEEKNEAGRPQHGCLEFERAAPHGGDPREDLHAGRHGDHHRSDHEISLGSSRHADGVHVVRPHHKADAADRHHRIGHAEVAENRFLREGRHDLTDHSKTRHDQDVDLRMSEEPEQVLEQNRVATAGRSEKSSFLGPETPFPGPRTTRVSINSPPPPIIAGMTMKKIMIRPCAVVKTLNMWASWKNCSAGCISSSRMPIERTPPTNPPTNANTRYIVPMSLWLVE